MRPQSQSGQYSQKIGEINSRKGQLVRTLPREEGPDRTKIQADIATVELESEFYSNILQFHRRFDEDLDCIKSEFDQRIQSAQNNGTIKQFY